MPGTKGRSGRKRKPSLKIRADGGYEEGRHGDRLDGILRLTGPRKPEDLTPAQSKIWDDVTGDLPQGVLGKVDEDAMIAMVNWYGVYLDCMSVLKGNPMDQVAMKQTKIAWDSFWRVAAEFGIGPSNRARLKIPHQEKPDDPLERLRAKKAAAM